MDQTNTKPTEGTKPEELPITPSPMDNTYTPLVTDEHIERASGDPIAAQAVSAYEFGKCIGMARGMASARSTYEAERVQTHAELAELRAENERMREERQQEAPATRLSEEELKRLTDFWKSAWEDEGTREKIINELWDYTVFMENTIKVYDHLTRGNITKINTLPQAVIDEVERIHQQEIDEAVREAEVEEVRGLSVEQAKDLLRAVNAGAWERIDGALRVNAVSQEHVTQCFKDLGIELEPPF